MKRSMDELLDKAFDAKRFADGDGARVWSRAEKRLRMKRSPLKWAVPLAAAATVFVTLIAVPQARAAMVELMHRAMSIFDYMGMDDGERPGNAAVEGLLQSDVPAEFAVSVQPGGEWVKQVGLSFDDVLYDGKYIFFKYTIDPKGIKNFMRSSQAEVGQTVHFKEYSPNDKLALDGIGELQIANGGGMNYRDDGAITDVICYDASDVSMSGTVSGTLVLDFFNSSDTQVDENTGLINQQPAGTIQVRFSFDASEGPKHNRVIDLSGVRHALRGTVAVSHIAWGKDTVTFTNRSIPLEGCYVTADTVSVKPTGIDVKLHFFPSAGLPEDVCQDLLESVYPVFLNGGATLHGVEHESTKGSAGDFIIDCSIPMEYASGLDTLTVQLWVRYQAAAGGQPIAPDTPVTLPCPPGTFMALYDSKAQMPSATFEIAISE